MANAAAAPAAATSEESLWVSAARPLLVAAAEADEVVEALSEVVVAVLVPVRLVLDAAVVSVLAFVPVSVELELALVLVLEAELDLLFEQTTSLGRSVTSPRAQIDLATLMVTVLKSNMSAHCTCTCIHCA
jgi:hypothetical protein